MPLSFPSRKFQKPRTHHCAPTVNGARCAPYMALSGLRQEKNPPCFAAGTLVHTRGGLKPIEEIQVGDWVLSRPQDEIPPTRFREEGEYTYRQVTQTFVQEDKPICDVLIFDLANNVEEKIRVTPNHPFFVKRLGWTPASQLNYKSVLFLKDFSNVVVGKIDNSGSNAQVHNFEVNEFHTYNVGILGVWVHNDCEFENFPTLRGIDIDQ